eukprot:TRINITY_DN20150_c0_g1_i1.p1 TRINITY_DN20150_c0_g1~~TRINITY_DN20150_c0_g1_i1.p1  ORF type:complete len:211 (+),score=36.34 TRINITY_DN20150_c0_g1_i1:135-767(+)
MNEDLRHYGVIHLRGALKEEEQHELFLQIKDMYCGAKTKAGAYGSFLISAGSDGPSRREEFHELGERLFARVAEELSHLSAEELAEPVWRRMAEAYMKEKPLKPNHVSGVNYQKGATMLNHTDCDKPLYTMSLALGDSCDFTVGRKTARPRRNEIAGKPVTLQMESGDVLFFDGGSVPHCVERIHANSAPAFWRRAKTDAVRLSVLFRDV